MKKVREFVDEYAATCIFAVIGFAVYFLSLAFDIDIFENLIGFLRAHEHAEADEAIVAGVLVVCGLIADLVRARGRRNRELEIQRQRLRVLKATMTTVQDIVNNSLNGLVLVRLEGETGRPLDRESLRLMDSIIQETSRKLKELGDLDDTPEKKVADGIVVIDVERASKGKRT